MGRNEETVRGGRQGDPQRSDCPIACTLDLLGDRWTLVLIRDMLKLGKRRYGEFVESAEGIPTNVLADRLKRMEQCGLVTRTLYNERPPRWEYHLTSMGRELEPVLDALLDWGAKHLLGGTRHSRPSPRAGETRP